MNTGLKQVTAAAFAAKFRSKREIFTFLTVEFKAYLCPFECLTIYFLRDLATSRKKGKSLSVVTDVP